MSDQKPAIRDGGRSVKNLFGKVPVKRVSDSDPKVGLFCLLEQRSKTRRFSLYEAMTGLSLQVPIKREHSRKLEIPQDPEGIENNIRIRRSTKKDKNKRSSTVAGRATGTASANFAFHKATLADELHLRNDE
ncbi:unnamed protein product [Nesidiocoris tenuis]|uniref:Uncharacterized protein n=1 Tax=Nesidiocoris tenuis TaxID=355587 RepID=A0A6H5HJZ0_9HEMI|nr:unnamed protein product [Nesidiocoris tenuis]